jgi:F-type H+-transporting ATPase subunit epsilon
MADKLQFSLVSPEAELFSGEVDQVDIPGSEGDLGILPNHSPLMAAIRTGAITVYADGAETKYLVQGGFADVTPAGLTILAEKASLLSDLSADALKAEIDSVTKALEAAEGETALVMQQNLDGLKAVAGA